MESQRDFNTGDVVWAKRKHYPFWSAKIVSPPTVKEGAYTVKEMQKEKSSTLRQPQHYVFFFFGTENCAWISDENIVPHSEETFNKVTKKKSFSYVKAINKIIEESGSVGELKPKVKKIQEPSRRSTNYSTLISSIPSFQVSINKPIDVQSMGVSPDVKELYLKMKIGFIGLGMMGQKVVKKLLNAGHNVSVWNRTPEKCKESVDTGARQFSSPADLLLNCDITFCLLSGPEAVKSIFFGNGGIWQALEKCNIESKGYVELTSIHLDTLLETAEAITDKGGRYLAAPISGSLTDAEKSSLSACVGGDLHLFHTCSVYFSVMCTSVLYLGPDIKVSNLNLIAKMVPGVTSAALSKSMC
ncbi:putative oxidoreductase GLYR1 [Trichonephila clavipes]|nr:putative oxidoreductase GLYR1 [Trichonephila clavipes]